MKAELKKEGKEWLKATVIAIVLLIFIRAFFITSYVVEGGSMFPTLEDGNKLIVNKFIYRISDLERFDVIVFHANKHADYVKRVIGLPGDTVEYKNEQLYINGELYEEPYLGTYGLDKMQPVILKYMYRKENCLFSAITGKTAWTAVISVY